MAEVKFGISQKAKTKGLAKLDLTPGPDHGPSEPSGMKATEGPSYIYLKIAILTLC